jgi:nickel-type superoxide dismutase maturation protease
MSRVRVHISGDSMWPTFPNGSLFELIDCTFEELNIGDVVLAQHPFHSEVQIVKRIESFRDRTVFLVGDNPDPLASEDSHNFGAINEEAILGRCELIQQ